MSKMEEIKKALTKYDSEQDVEKAIEDIAKAVAPDFEKIVAIIGETGCCREKKIAQVITEGLTDEKP